VSLAWLKYKMQRQGAQAFFFFNYKGFLLVFLLSELHYETLLVQSLFLMEVLFISFRNQHFQQWEMAVLIAKRLFHFWLFLSLPPTTI